MNKKCLITNTALAVLVLCYSLTPLGSMGQTNLVPNPSFEITPNCNIDLMTPPPPPWYSPNPNNPFGYVNACASNICCTVPLNKSGDNYQQAHSGQAYIGGFFYYPSWHIDVRQYIQTKLLDSLKNNHYYYVSFYVNRQDSNKYAVNNIGLLISDTAITNDKVLQPYGLIPANPQIITPNNPVITDTMNWVKVSGVYKAHGGEKYITIGNFKPDSLTTAWVMNPNAQVYDDYASYFIDDVSVIDSALLPVLLSSYHIQQFNHQIINTWQTATEVNVSHFNIQRNSSGNAKDFQTIGTLPSKGIGKYEWADNNAPLSLGRGAGGEALFYRLETVDKDGERMYSDIKKITMSNVMSDFSIYPNPSKGKIFIELPFGKSNKYKILLTDTYSKKISEKETLNSENLIQLNVNVSPGIYFLTITNTKTGKQGIKKIILE